MQFMRLKKVIGKCDQANIRIVLIGEEITVVTFRR